MIIDFDPLKIPNQLKKGPPLKHPCCVKVQHPWKNGYLIKFGEHLKQMDSKKLWHPSECGDASNLKLLTKLEFFNPSKYRQLVKHG